MPHFRKMVYLLEMPQTPISKLTSVLFWDSPQRFIRVTRGERFPLKPLALFSLTLAGVTGQQDVANGQKWGLNGTLGH